MSITSLKTTREIYTLEKKPILFPKASTTNLNSVAGLHLFNALLCRTRSNHLLSKWVITNQWVSRHGSRRIVPHPLMALSKRPLRDFPDKQMNGIVVFISSSIVTTTAWTDIHFVQAVHSTMYWLP